MEYVCQLKERDRQYESGAVAHLDGLLDDVLFLLGTQSDTEMLLQRLDV